jgi:hypothetical protein
MAGLEKSASLRTEKTDRRRPMAWTRPILGEICIGMEIPDTLPRGCWTIYTND